MNKDELIAYIIAMIVVASILAIFIGTVYFINKPDRVYKTVTPVGTTDKCSFFQDEYLSEREYSRSECGYTLKNCTSGIVYKCVGIMGVVE